MLLFRDLCFRCLAAAAIEQALRQMSQGEPTAQPEYRWILPVVMNKPAMKNGRARHPFPAKDYPLVSFPAPYFPPAFPP